MSTNGSVQGEGRRQALADIIERDGSVQLAAAAAEFGVSEMTIRRDLDDLESVGLARRVRGGATRAGGPRHFTVRSKQRSAAKALIAQKALGLVPEAGAVALDASTTAGALAARLGRHQDLAVVTNSWENFTALRRSGISRALLTGGEADELTDSMVGPLAVRGASSLNLAVLFASASGVDPDFGSSDVSLEEAQVKLEFARVAERVILLVDSAKLGQRDLARSFAWDRVDLLITELDPADERLAAYREVVQVA